MVAEAFADPAVRRVIAHTLPEPNASNHILAQARLRLSTATRWSAAPRPGAGRSAALYARPQRASQQISVALN